MSCNRNKGRSNTNNIKPMKLIGKRELGREGERDATFHSEFCKYYDLIYGTLVAEMKMELVFKTCFKYKSKSMNAQNAF